MDNNFINEINKRRTFAIISHPDAGKTTLTEKFLLYGGAIRLAGSVKSRKAQKHAVSDWMEIEKQRGISVTSSVMQFNYDGACINILDTPGHQDFSEDTYRTLTAADSAVMVIDCAKGVEPQTKKLFRVCKDRNIPIFTFINKLDRAGKDPFELMEEIEKVLGIQSYPMNWPIGTDGDFKGVYNRQKKRIELFQDGDHGQNIAKIVSKDLYDEGLADIIGADYYQRLRDEVELLDMAGDDFDHDKVQSGELTPLFFGSAMTNFGVEPFLESFLKLTYKPEARKSNQGMIPPENQNFSGFIFKIQANMNPAHRDRLAFIRICSGKFEKGMSVYNSRTGKKIRLAQPQQFLAQDREIVDTAYPGDIIGVHDPGLFKISDTLSEADASLKYERIPVFPPEHFSKIIPKNSMKRKQFLKGIQQLAEEGAIQVFKRPNIGIEEYIVGVVGVLQFQVLEYRLKNEYSVDILMENMPHRFIRWIEMDEYDPDRFSTTMDSMLVEDHDGSPAIILQNEWSIGKVEDRNPGVVLKDIYKKDLD